MDFKLNVNVDDIKKQLDGSQENLELKVRQAVAGLAAQTHAKIIQYVQQNLRSTRKMYIDNMFLAQVDENSWVVGLKEEGMWLEEGLCVVYSSSTNNTPSVLTPDGETKITDVKIGTLVLNKYGKWTKVKKIIDQHLVEEAKMELHRVESTNIATKRKNTKILAVCKVCNKSVWYKKFHSKTMKKGRYCPSCFYKKQVVHIELIRKRPFKGKNRLVLTANHPVYTQNGWIPAGELTKDDILVTPSWSRCENCGVPTEYGNKFCGSKCGASFFQKDLLAKGRHKSQDPEWLANIYRKTMKNLKRISGAEDVAARHIESLGYSVSFYKNNTVSDCIRQYPVKKNNNRYYYIDFYFPKLKLALEIDGKIFHCEKKDSIRDKYLKKINIDTVRVPAKYVRNKDFADKTIKPILANHENFISYLPIKIKSIKKINPDPSCYPMRRRWDISVEEGQSFVCQGILIHNSPHSMVQDLLQGKKYRVIPMDQTKTPQETPMAMTSLTETLKKELRRYKIPIRKIEKNPDGSPKLGLLHSLDVNSKEKGPTGTPYLQGVRVYQKMVGEKGKEKVQRFIGTFRTVSAKHEGQGRWFHPGIEPRKFFDKAFQWAVSEWDGQILPEIKKSIAL